MANVNRSQTRRTLVVTPWDKAMVAVIEKAIMAIRSRPQPECHGRHGDAHPVAAR
ncbi:MAG: hypothetical protein MZV65_16870 [Chromatiales bacterium]|nr:hypothetical protein [Chromatiales bacterium]